MHLKTAYAGTAMMGINFSRWSTSVHTHMHFIQIVQSTVCGTGFLSYHFALCKWLCSCRLDLQRQYLNRSLCVSGFTLLIITSTGGLKYPLPAPVMLVECNIFYLMAYFRDPPVRHAIMWAGAKLQVIQKIRPEILLLPADDNSAFRWW